MLSRVAMRHNGSGSVDEGQSGTSTCELRRSNDGALSVLDADLSRMFPSHIVVAQDGRIQSFTDDVGSLLALTPEDSVFLFGSFLVAGDGPVNSADHLRASQARGVLLSPLLVPSIRLRASVFEVGLDSLLLVLEPDASLRRHLEDDTTLMGISDNQLGPLSEERSLARLLGATGVTVSYRDRSNGTERLNRGAELPPLLASVLQSGVYDIDGIRDLLTRPGLASAFHVREVLDYESSCEQTGFEIRLPSGRSWMLRSIELDDGGAALVCRDISRLRKVERHLFHQQKVESVGLLTSGVAHDFNNLLTIISGGLHLLSVTEPSSERVIDAIRVASDRSATLVDQLLRLAEHEATEDGHTVLADTLRTLGELLPSTLGPDVSLRMVDDLGATVLANSDLLESALLNLIVNARDAMPRGGHIDVRIRSISRDEATRQGLTASRTYCAIEVVDDGEGIKPELVEFVFDPFFTTKSASSGTGLGLCMVKDFAERSGGLAQASSDGEVGTTMTLFLQCVDPDTVHARSGASQDDRLHGGVGFGTSGADGSASLAGKTVLIVDDEVDLAWTVSSLVVSLGGEAVVANGVNEAKRVLEKHPGSLPDVVLTDYYMVDGTGPDVLALCSRLCPRASVHFMSGNIDLRAHGRDLDSEVLSKPFTIEALTNTLVR